MGVGSSENCGRGHDGRSERHGADGRSDDIVQRQ